jgi:hypothetical protein
MYICAQLEHGGDLRSRKLESKSERVMVVSKTTNSKIKSGMMGVYKSMNLKT